MKKEKIAVLLLNLGGPTELSAVKPFLFNLFNDKAIISLPQPFRYFLAKLISGKREKEAKIIYSQLGGKSPLLENTQAQANALERILNKAKDKNFKAFSLMRYWIPRADEVAEKIKKFQPDRILLLPLYPQFSTTTTKSSIEEWYKVADKHCITANTHSVCCYYNNNAFLRSHAIKIKILYDKIKKNNSRKIRILFSAHGIPMNRIKKGDPYQYQIEQTAEGIVKELSIKNLDYVVCYQSKVGPLEWLSPSTEDEIHRASEEGIAIIIIPVAFVSEHSETLIELDIEYKKIFINSGNNDYYRVPTLDCHELFIKSLASICNDALHSENFGCITSWQGQRLCPDKFAGCINACS